jgi:hypothetical protein
VEEPGLDFFVALETQVWEALVNGDPDADRALLTSDFLGVYTTGFANRSEHAAQLANGPTMASYAIRESRLVRVSPTNVLLCYRADYQSIQEGRPAGEESMFISSLWTERDGRWMNSFSQDTPAA